MIDLATDNADSLEWQNDQTSQTLARLHVIEGYNDLGTAVLHYTDAAERWTPVRAGDRWFHQIRIDATSDLPALTVRDAVDGDPRVLVDLNTHTTPGGTPIALGWVTPSPNGTLLAYSITTEGTEVNNVLLLDVESGRRLPDIVPWNIYAPPSWLPDESGFWCATREMTADVMGTAIRRFRIGEPAQDWSADLPRDLSFPRPEVSKDGRHVAIATGNTESRIDYLIHDDLSVTTLLDGVEGMFRGVIIGDDLVALTDHGAARNRIVRIPLATSTDETTWTEILSETDYVTTDFELLGDTLIVGSLRDCSTAIDVIDLITGERTAVPLPGRGGAGAVNEGYSHPMLPVFERGDGEITFLYSDLATSPAVYRYVIAERRLHCLQPPSCTLADVTVSYVSAVSADGTAIPAHVIHRSDLDLSRPHPTLLHGYGGFNLAELPAYLKGNAAWVEAGGIYVLSHLRGGSEFGRDWWRAGRRANKQNTFDDLYAIAERLIDLGWTSRAQLAVYGASNGGLLTAAALTQRPDLWAAVVSDVPVTDLLNIQRDPLTYAIGRDEYGDAQIPAERAWLAAIDPLSHVAPADYPATLVIAGANDPRCPALHARLFADALQRAQTGTAPILLRVHADQGHGVQGAPSTARRLTEILAFCAAHTGLELRGSFRMPQPSH
jgi:prolyl oligopeptidase